MDEAMKAKSHVISAASFVEEGMQDACDDACSICLEAFCDSNPYTVTSCKHEFHLQCVLEWCQRSSSCPMCWQPISLKDPTSQELLDAVERERSFRSMPSRNAAIFHHPTLGDFELQHIPVGLDAAELEDRIVQHFASAAAIGRTQRISRRSSSPHAHPQLVMLSANHNASSAGPDGAENESAATTLNDLSPPHMSSSIRINRTSGSSSRSPDVMATRQGISHSSRTLRNHAREPSLANVGPSEFQSISDSWKSRLSTMSMKYKDSLSKSTRGWKDKLFSRSSSMAEIGSDVLREVNAGMASVSRMMDRLETRENNIATRSPGANGSTTGYSNQDYRGTGSIPPPNSSNTCSFATS